MINRTYKIDGIEYSTMPNYLEKDGLMRPVIAEHFNIEVIDVEVEVVEPPALTAIKSVLADEISALNVKYPALELTANDTIMTAIPKLLGVGALKDEVVYLKMLYDTVKEVQAQ